MFRGRRNTATTRDAQAENSQSGKVLAGGGWGSNSLSFSHAESPKSHLTGGYARRFFAAIAATLLVVSMAAGTVAGIGVTAASAATPLSVTTTSPLPLAPLNTPYSVTLAATGGTGSYTWSVATGLHPAQLAEPGFHDWCSLRHADGQCHRYVRSDRYRLGQPC